MTDEQPGVKRAQHAIPHLREWREYRGLTASELARRSRLARGTVWSAEQGRLVTQRIVDWLAEALDVSPAELTYGRPPKNGGK